MTDHESIRGWLRDVADLAVANAERPEIAEGAQLFRSVIDGAAPVAFDPRPLPVLHDVAAMEDTELGRRFAGLAPLLPWVESPRWDDGGRERALCVLSEMFELPGVIAGLLYLDAGCDYPLHSHSPQELYVVISGTGDWRFGGAEDHQSMAPGRTLYNHPHDLHAIRAGGEPLVAMYVLWGSGLD